MRKEILKPYLGRHCRPCGGNPSLNLDIAWITGTSPVMTEYNEALPPPRKYLLWHPHAKLSPAPLSSPHHNGGLFS